MALDLARRLQRERGASMSKRKDVELKNLRRPMVCSMCEEDHTA